MHREYMDQVLKLLAEESGFRPAGWSAQEVSEFRILVQCARAARLDTDLRNTRMLRIEPDDADPDKGRTALSSGRVLNLTFKNHSSQYTVVFELRIAEVENP